MHNYLNLFLAGLHPKRQHPTTVVSIFATLVLTLTCWQKLALAEDNSAVDPYIAELYEYNCKACHGNKASVAPPAFDTKLWANLLKKKTLPGLVKNSINGVGSMPAMGSCMECGPEEIEQLIVFMSKAR